jgi:hypothetical protein
MTIVVHIRDIHIVSLRIVIIHQHCFDSGYLAIHGFAYYILQFVIGVSMSWDRDLMCAWDAIIATKCTFTTRFHFQCDS